VEAEKYFVDRGKFLGRLGFWHAKAFAATLQRNLLTVAGPLTTPVRQPGFDQESDGWHVNGMASQDS
jgi:hypothetical protein